MDELRAAMTRLTGVPGTTSAETILAYALLMTHFDPQQRGGIDIDKCMPCDDGEGASPPPPHLQDALQHYLWSEFGWDPAVPLLLQLDGGRCTTAPSRQTRNLLALPAGTSTPSAQTSALTALYVATNGPGWRKSENWLVGDPCDKNSSWHGVTCTVYRMSQVTELRLDLNNLDGTIPADLARLTALESLRLTFNSLRGSLPTQVARLTAVRNLEFSSNLLTKGLPTELGLLSHMRDGFNVMMNKMTSSIPTQLGR